MKTVKTNVKKNEFVLSSNLKMGQGVYAIFNNTLCGMIVYIPGRGYIHKKDVLNGSTGFHETIDECIESGQKMGYRFVTDVNVKDVISD